MENLNIRKKYDLICRCREQVSRLNEYLYYNDLGIDSDLGVFVSLYRRHIDSFNLNPTERTLERLRIYRVKATIWEVENID